MKNIETVYLALGSNLGDRVKNLQHARSELVKFISITRASQIYETLPWGVEEQPLFLNQVLECQTDLSPQDLLRKAKEIEASLGRVPSYRYGPRLIDIDILIYGCHEVSSPDLIIPHPRMAERAFVLVPLAELASDLELPGEQAVTIKSLLKKIDASGVKIFKDQG